MGVYRLSSRASCREIFSERDALFVQKILLVPGCHVLSGDAATSFRQLSLRLSSRSCSFWHSFFNKLDDQLSDDDLFLDQYLLDYFCYRFCFIELSEGLIVSPSFLSFFNRLHDFDLVRFCSLLFFLPDGLSFSALPCGRCGGVERLGEGGIIGVGV